MNDSKIEYLQPDYEGMSKVLSEFEKLYKVSDNQKLLDECLKEFCLPNKIIIKKES